jgi:hypothetical protein
MMKLAAGLCVMAFSGLALGMAQPDRTREAGQPQGRDRAQQPGERRSQEQQRPDERAGQPGAVGGVMAQPDMAEMMAAWQAAITPGEQHRYLEQFAGEWRTTTRIYMEGPGSEPTVSQGTATFRMIMDGRYLQQDYRGEMMGQPMHGMGLMGYDNTRKLFIGTWLDNMGTSMSHFKGGLDQTGRILTMYGDMDEPMSGEIGKPVRYRLRIEGPNRKIFEIQEVIYGEPFTAVEITYERTGAAPQGGRGPDGAGGAGGRGPVATPPGRGQDDDGAPRTPRRP